MTFQNIYIYIYTEREKNGFLTIPYHTIWMPSAVSRSAENIRDSKWISGTKKGEGRLVNTE